MCTVRARSHMLKFVAFCKFSECQPFLKSSRMSKIDLVNLQLCDDLYGIIRHRDALTISIPNK